MGFRRPVLDAVNIGPFCMSYRMAQVNPFDDPELAAAFANGAR
jgi:hypothetical protein